MVVADDGLMRQVRRSAIRDERRAMGLRGRLVVPDLPGMTGAIPSGTPADRPYDRQAIPHPVRRHR